MDKGLFKKVLDEQALSAEEALALDGELEGTAQTSVGKIVGALEDHAPSLSWRSGLNQRLAKESRGRRFTPVFRYSFALVAVAGATLLVATFMRAPGATRPTDVNSPVAADSSKHESLEDTLMYEHQEEASKASLGIYVSFNDESRG
ncbi:MAG TPA: hypothetical protein VNI20_02275 [Fimbriimonadaceae bacterium]|nr:hypothetical protein [Fimbriimonadaceae bacterium]